MSIPAFKSLRPILPLVLLLAGLLAAPPAAGSSAGVSGEVVSSSSARASAEAKRIEKKVRGCTNRRRINHGLNPLTPSEPLSRAAGLLASDMQRHGYFGHIDHEGRDVNDRVGLFAPKARYLPLGENIAAGYGPRGACKAWMNSSGHRANMLEAKYNVIGVGFADGGKYDSYFVQVFGRGPRN